MGGCAVAARRGDDHELRRFCSGDPRFHFGGSRRLHFCGNGNRRGTRRQLVEVPVEVQLAENFWVGREGKVKNGRLENRKTAAPGKPWSLPQPSLLGSGSRRLYPISF